MSRYLILTILLVSLFACKKEQSATPDKSSANAGPPKAMKVNGIIVHDEFTSGRLSTTGSILPNEEVDIKSEVSGKITGIYFKEGTYVKQGQVLVKLDDDDLQAQLNKLRIEIRLAEQKEKRQKQLLEASAVSQEEYDITETNVSLLKANEKILITSIEKTRVSAPFSGVIGLKNVSPGAIINPATTIASLQNTQPLKVEFSIPEKYNDLVAPGKTIEFRLANSDATHQATVYAKEPRVDQSTRTTRVRANFSNPGGKVVPGAFAEISISVGEKSKVKMIPTMAYIPDISGAKVMVKREGKATSIPVKAGTRTETEIQILEGLNDGDTVITSGILQLKPGNPVEVNVIQEAH